MNIQYCSDLHLEFAENRQVLTKKPLVPKGEILLLAGDIMLFSELEKFKDFIDFVSDHFSAVYWVPGNHEYYGFDIVEKEGSFSEKIRENFFLVNNQSVRYKNMNLHFSTLWSMIGPKHEWTIQRSIADFSWIKENGKKLSLSKVLSMHQESLAFLDAAVKSQQPGQTIIITHHVPTLMNYPPVYRNSVLTEAFATELFDFIESSGADYWIYGHHHVNTPEFNIGRTRLLTNQMGYVRQFEHKTFRRDALIQLMGEISGDQAAGEG